MARKQNLPSEEKARILFETVEDRKAENPVLIDLRDKRVNLADFFIICTGLAVPHLRAIAEHVLEKVDELRLPRPTVSGEEVAEWILLDFGDIVLHIMSEEARERYKLEQFWSTPQPKGALPPVPGSLPERHPLDRTPLPGTPEVEPVEGEYDETGFEDDDFESLEDDESFFADADTAVKPVEQDEI
ncbi:MAG: ribosome silencing factor [Armatimonadota bacterium]